MGLIIPGRPASFTCAAFNDRDTIIVEPFRARAFPIIKDLVIDRSALDRVVQAGGFISARTGSAPEANSILVPKRNADWPWKQPLASVAARVWRRVQMLRRCYLQAQKFRTSPFCRKAHRNVIVVFSGMVRAMDAEGFGNCTNIYECVAVCPAEISGSVMAKMYREYAVAKLLEKVGE